MVETVVIFIFLIVGLFLLFKYSHLLRELKKISWTTLEIRNGNMNMRYRVHARQPAMQELGGELNRLVDYFQQAYDRMRFLEEERKRLIANISHDLRTPLTSLLGYMEALQRDETLSEEERADFLRIAASKGDALLTLLQDFFELARLEADDSVPEFGRVNLTELVPEILLDFYPEFTKADITPIIKLPDKPVYVRADAAHLRRILNNLISNALRYGREGKEIGISLREEPNVVWVEVWDRGNGVAEQDLPRIFERLYTGEASRNSTLQGTGLGLTIAKNLVEKQGGRIAVTSAPHEKTVFSFSLIRI
ncbi:HAMP domain-containing histidine kinase [Cohnella pontilimi]|uniref:histidine kinase n=1 Tax=Cohnella pontilimi TaxID=2564100 RepID=A0A4U0FDH6_9BACL|nr:HAMP domain-containing sensor histidine kinase [Cohnella pontilimi]TJY42827.1 HAMP domain-containing histidine kinase [Cohnella pontilimi]